MEHPLLADALGPAARFAHLGAPPPDRPGSASLGRVAVAAPDAPCVLLVDDDTLVRETLAEQLEMLGFATLAVDSGEAALALLDAGASVDLLLSDLSMPGIDGIETIRRARQRRPRLPCVLITGNAGPRLGGGEAETFRLIRKPVAAGALGAQLRDSLAAAECAS